VVILSVGRPLKKRAIVCFVSLLLVLATIISVGAAPPVEDQLVAGWDQEPPPTGTVTIGLRPDSVAKVPGTTFVMEIVIDATSQEIDSAQVDIDFDPNYLTVVDETGEEASEIIAGRALPDPMFNTVDNDLGQIVYAAGYWAQGAVLQVPFILAKIRFRTQELTPRTDVSFYFKPNNGVSRLGTKVKIGADSVPIHAITDGQVRIYVYRLLMPLVFKGHHHY